MNHEPMMMRFRWCRKCNEFICVITVVTSFVGLTRLLHLGNISGSRYLGYMITCPIMMVELVVLISPMVPCYRFTVVVTYLVTLTCLASGYMSSMWGGSLFE